MTKKQLLLGILAVMLVEAVLIFAAWQVSLFLDFVEVMSK